MLNSEVTEITSLSLFVPIVNLLSFDEGIFELNRLRILSSLACGDRLDIYSYSSSYFYDIIGLVLDLKVSPAVRCC